MSARAVRHRASAAGDAPDTPAGPEALPGIALPRQTTALYGHGAAARAIIDAFHAGRLGHALMMCGPRGIGKATLCFHLARHILGEAVRQAQDVPDGEAARAAAYQKMAALIANGAAPDLIHLTCPFDARTKKFRTEIPVDAVRRLRAFFFRTTSIENGWRLAIIDSADALNFAAQNALLKILEEPPSASLLFLVAHRPARLPATLRSRCAMIRLAPLSQSDTARAVADCAGTGHTPGQIAHAVAHSMGSPGAALAMLAGDGAARMAGLAQILDSLPAPPRDVLVGFAERFAKPGGRQELEFLADQIAIWLETRLDDAPTSGHAIFFADAFGKTQQIMREVTSYNLDAGEAVLKIIAVLAHAVHCAQAAR